MLGERLKERAREPESEESAGDAAFFSAHVDECLETGMFCQSEDDLKIGALLVKLFLLFGQHWGFRDAGELPASVDEKESG